MPPAASKAPVRRANRSGADMPSNRRPAPHRAARVAAAVDTAALSTGTGRSRQARSAGSPSTGPSPSPRSMPTSRPSSALKTGTASAGSRPAASKSSGSAPAATPRPTRPGWRAWSQATSSATRAVGRSGSSNGHAAAQPSGCSSSTNVAICSGWARYPAKPPWCSLVITPSKPFPEREPGLVAQLGHDGAGVELVVGVEPEGDRAGGEGRRRCGGVHARQPTARAGQPAPAVV